MGKRWLAIFLLAASAAAWQTAIVPDVAPAPLDYVCPMDPDIRSDKPGVCPRCGMTLRLGIPKEIEYPMDLTVTPAAARPGEKVDLDLRVRNPDTGKPVEKFQIVHEKLFHLFIVSQDLKYFVHDHPVAEPGGLFRYRETFPKPGLFRVLGDFYPDGGTPQLIERTVIVAGDGNSTPVLQPAKLLPDLGRQHAENMDVELTTDPVKPIAGMKTLMFFRVNPSEGLEKYIGAWAHMLAVSDDLVDMIHNHPFLADGGPLLQFNMIFPRARTYRVWVQFERKGVVNTVAFNVPVSELE